MSLATLAPIPLNWLVAVLILILAARPDSLHQSIRRFLTSWLGVLGLFAVGLSIFIQQPIVGTSLFILMFALLAEEHKRTKREYFDGSTVVDEVTTSNLWYSEKAFDERPKRVEDKTVNTAAPSSG